MKHYLLFLLTMLCALAYSQDDYTPMLKDGRRWGYKYISREDDEISWITVMGDTVYNGRTCKLLLYGNRDIVNEPYVPVIDGIRQPAIIQWEENKILYHVEWEYDSYEKPSREWILLDFNSGYDDKYRDSEIYTVVEDSIEVKGRSYRRLTYFAYKANNPEEYLDYWVKVEGIGASDTGHWVYSPYKPKFSPYDIVAVYDGDELIFEYDDFFVAGKTPAKIVMTTMDEESSARAPIFDLTGKRITEPRKGEIYIKGGKKYVK